MNVMAIIAALGVFFVATPAFFFLGRRIGVNKGRLAEIERQAASKATAEDTAKRIIAEAEREIETMRKGAIVSGKEEVMKLREAAEQDIRARRASIEHEERRVSERESSLDRKLEIVEQRDREVGKRASDFGRRSQRGFKLPFFHEHAGWRAFRRHSGRPRMEWIGGAVAPWVYH